MVDTVDVIIATATTVQPWWATSVVSGLFGLGGTLAGGAIAFVSMRGATSRQMRRGERDSRRTVYARFLEVGMMLYQSCPTLADFHAQLDKIELDTQQLLVHGTDQDHSDLKSITDDLCAHVERVVGEITNRYDEALRCYYEVTLYAPRAIRVQAASTATALENMLKVYTDRGRTDGERSIAKTKAHRAISDFNGIARADVQSPGTLPLSIATRRLKKLQGKDDIEASADDELTPSPEKALGGNPE
jgi:hypothetical protein